MSAALQTLPRHYAVPPKAIHTTPRYTSDAFAYSLPGGFANASSRASRQSDVAPRRSVSLVADRARTLLVADASCDLPSDWLAHHGVAVLPIKVELHGENFLDTRDTARTLAFFRDHRGTRLLRARTAALSALETRDFVQSRLQVDTDFAIEIASAAHRSEIYVNSLAAAQNLMLTHARMRRASRVCEPFKMWVVDSENLFGGQGVLVADAVRCLQEGMTAQKIVQHLDRLHQQVHTLIVPRDARYFCSSAVHWLAEKIGKSLDIKAVAHAHAGKVLPCLNVRGFDDAAKRVLEIATAKVREGLETPQLCVSYAGALATLEDWPAFLALRTACERRGVTLHLATMSVAGGVNVGAGALALAFACRSLDV
jgi:DegV family protein with EDD domain